ncbi:MAG: response regulator [Cyclobacteriaceae bacterium]
MPKFDSILLIDDDEITNFINHNLLEELQLASKVIAISDAEEALTYLQDHSPSVIFLDLKMPVFDGFDFLEAFGKLSKFKKSDIQIIILTTSSNPKDVNRLAFFNFSKILNKPLTKEKIIEAIG